MIGSSSSLPVPGKERCPVCGYEFRVDPDASPEKVRCPNCGSGLWYAPHVLTDGIDFVVRDAILPQLDAETRDDAIRRLIASLAAANAIPASQQEEVTRSVLKRESLGTTGIGQGIALPHARHPAVEHVVAAIGLSHRGLDFHSLDGQPVHVVMLLVSPSDRPADHLRALEAISRKLRHCDFTAG